MGKEPIIVKIDPDLADLIPGFLEHRRTELEKIKLYLADNDFTALDGIGHNLKGLGCGYGFDALSEFGVRLEILAVSEDSAAIETLISELADYLDNIQVVYI